MVGDSVDKLLLVQIAGVLALLGHAFPVFFGFKGGKAVATGLGILLVCNYQIALICLVAYIIVVSLTRVSALGSLTGVLLFPILATFMTDNYLVPGNYVYFGTVVAILIFWLHRGNIQRLLSGKENKIDLKSKV